MRGLVWLSALAGVAVVVGCGDQAASADEREERDPHVISGRKLVEEGQYQEAVEVYKKAIENEPSMARPHLDVALTYQRLIANAQASGGEAEAFIDFHVRSIYHFDRYLELRPNAEKAEFIEEQKLKVVASLAAFLINRSPEVREVVTERNALIQERAGLKRQLAAALAGSQPSTQKPATTSTPAPAPTSGQSVTQTVPKTAKPAQPKTDGSATHQIYHVVSGDTLTKIANAFYEDPGKWDVIFEANRDTMKNSNDLKVGQTLVIPAIGN